MATHTYTPQWITAFWLSSCSPLICLLFICPLILYIWFIFFSSLLVCGRCEQLDRGGGISTGITEICHFIPFYWIQHSVTQGQGFLCRKHYRGLRRSSLTFSMDWVLYIKSFLKVILSMTSGKKKRSSVQLLYIKCKKIFSLITWSSLYKLYCTY